MARKRKKKSSGAGAIVGRMGTRKVAGPGRSVRFVADDENKEYADTAVGRAAADEAGVDRPETDVTDDEGDPENFQTRYGLPAWGDIGTHARYGAQNVWLATGSTESYYRQQLRVGGRGLLQSGSEAYGYNTLPGQPSLYSSEADAPSKQRKPGSGRDRPAKDNIVNANDVIRTFIALFNGTDFEKQRAAEVQQLMYEGGFYGSGRPNLGAFGEGDLKAFVSALMGARLAGGVDMAATEGEGMPLNEFLERAAVSFEAQGVADLAELNRNRKPREARLTDDMEILGIANAGGADSAATDILGHFLTPTQMASYQDYIHEGENKEADQVYAADEIINLEGGTKGGDITEAPNASYATLDAFEKKENPVEYGANLIGKMAVEILESFQKHSPGGTGSA